jgi:hypothetical protein
MCGGHGLHHLIGTLAAAPTAQPDDNTHDVKLMYAQGSIDTETFHRLMTMAQGGYLSRQDLLHIGETLSQRTPLSLKTGPDDPRLSELETQWSRLQAQAEDAEKDAQKANLTDDQIRAYLEIRQGALFRAQAIQREIEALRNGK